MWVGDENVDAEGDSDSEPGNSSEDDNSDE
jgi:hypothetical protein